MGNSSSTNNLFIHCNIYPDPPDLRDKFIDLNDYYKFINSNNEQVECDNTDTQLNSDKKDISLYIKADNKNINPELLDQTNSKSNMNTEEEELNLKPQFSFIEPIQKFRKRRNIPKQLFKLDILDGSPPCSSFSMAGARERLWGKKRKYAEGAIIQELDTLFFEFIELAKKLQPKIILIENVKGILKGQAIKYVQKILKELSKAGYTTHKQILYAHKMGIPQKRSRVFFFAMRIV